MELRIHFRGSIMRIWIVYADDKEAKIFLKKDPTGEPCLCRTIRCKSKNFIRYVSEEMEIACGAGTDARLILQVKKNMLSRFKKQLSDQVRGAMIDAVDYPHYALAKPMAY